MRKFKYILIYLLVFSFVVVLLLSRSHFILRSNVTTYINKIYKQEMSIKSDSEFSYKDNNYRIIFSTPVNKKDELYVQCFQEKFNGLVYIPTYGSAQGKSKSLCNMINHFLNNANGDSFYVVYGYNKNFKASTFSVEKSTDGTLITEDISKKEYFLNTYTDITYGKITFKDANNNDISPFFYGQ
ncbi:hypothetical protein [Clostridium sp. 'White wine YQ']|uniref:hypothetical protein n=1 Tax=Clostridium sp. 'White wine YQ' TaxID=3027474 RepID=UPI0023664824|nr:hypothetical protein [Clostridium sp. 'White wine YQ']MDD7793099.1 hypothetical protein [Clostridium sp. 'White wine YQ']